MIRLVTQALMLLLVAITNVLADQTYLDRLNPPDTAETITAENRLFPEIDEDKISNVYQALSCWFDGGYYVYEFSGPWDTGFAISSHTLVAEEPCRNNNEVSANKYLGLIIRETNRYASVKNKSIRIKFEFDKAGGCPDGRVYFWENLYAYFDDKNEIDKAIYAVYGAC